MPVAARAQTRPARLDQRAFTLVELVIIIVTLGILAAVAIPRFGEIAQNSKVVATKSELTALKKAITGNPEAVSGGEYVDRGFEGDLGFVPSRLADLVTKPDSVPNYDKLTRLGWNGPYIDGSEDNYRKDAWEVLYVYDPPNRRIISCGGADSIVVTF